ncbi:flagellar filament capping protein FliD [Methylosarcina fibrata]|uniref:flagellar filament capping protein FliD n=1 Tax=Methylosarcina fibrata TaxID=105972 RepID=UPI0003A3459A|nr:flagellar filament capping protein FliD [Methylosarcina fibrata]
MTISAAGIGSGLDINGLVSQLMMAESKPLDLLKAQEKQFNTKLSAYGTLKSAISTFQTAMRTLTGSNGLSAQTVTSSNAGVLSATANGTAAAGFFTIEVTQLAQRQKLTSAGVADATASLGSGSLNIKVGANAEVVVTPTDYSLQGIRDAINESDAGITATIINDGTANGNHLVITSKDSGAANTVKITATDASLSQFDYDPASPVLYDANTPPAGMSQLQAAQDANLTVDGIPITKPSNTITDAIQGVSLNLTQVSGGTPVTITVGQDTETVKTSIDNFVKAFNDLKQTISNMTAYDPTTKTGGPLVGDAGARSVLNQIRGVLTGSVADAGSLSLLSDIGVSFQKDGTLSLDNSKLQKAIDGNFPDVAKLFTSTNGFATQLNSLTGDMLATDGLITSRTDGLNNSIQNLKKREDNMQARLDSIEERYRAQFIALDQALSSMQNTSAYLTQQLSALAKLSE